MTRYEVELEADVVRLKKEIETLEDQMAYNRDNSRKMLDLLYQIEDPRGGCLIQKAREIGVNITGHNSSNVPKNQAIRAEFLASIGR